MASFDFGGALQGGASGASAGSAAGPWGAVGGGVLGGLLGGFGGSGDNRNNNMEDALSLLNAQAQLQREFAQNGIRWRVADAQAAGVHPLYALGGAGATFSPGGVSVGGDRSSMDWGAFARDMGQDLSRAFDATRTENERYQARLRDLTLTGLEVDNDIKRAQLAKLNNAQTGPAFPAIDPTPVQQTQSIPGRPGVEQGISPSTGFAEGPGGVMTPIPGQVHKQRTEDSPLEIVDFWRNNMLPSFSLEQREALRPQIPAPPLKKWAWSPFAFGWVAIPWNAPDSWADRYARAILEDESFAPGALYQGGRRLSEGASRLYEDREYIPYPAY